MNNYEIISEYKKQYMIEYYKIIERDLKKIVNSPSTINKIIKYYSIAHDNQNNYYLIFNNKIIIKKYDNPFKWWEMRQKLKYWEAIGLNIQEPRLIAPLSCLK